MTDVTTEEQCLEAAGLSPADEQVIRELAARARAGGLQLTGEGGLLGRLTKMVVEGALEGEMDDHLGYSRHDPEGRNSGNSRNGHRSKTVITEAGPVELSVPRDRESTFTPQIVAKRQRRLTGIDDMVISLSAKGLTHGEIAAHLEEVYGAEVSKQTITNITERVADKLAEWQSRPLDPVYAVVFIDAIRVKIRDGQVANRPVYLALGVTADGERDILGLWAGEHGDGEGAKYWLRVLTEIKNRGTNDVLMVVCDGLKGLPDSVNSVWEKTIVQTCVVHYPSPAQFVQVRVEEGLGAAREGPQARVHRAVRGRRAGCVRRVQRQVGEALPGHHPAVGERLGRVRAVPAVRPRDKGRGVHD